MKQLVPPGDSVPAKKSSDAGVPSGAGASQVSGSISMINPSSHAVIASEATMSTMSQVTLPDSTCALTFASPSEALSSLMMVTSGFAAT